MRYLEGYEQMAVLPGARPDVQDYQPELLEFDFSEMMSNGLRIGLEQDDLGTGYQTRMIGVYPDQGSGVLHCQFGFVMTVNQRLS